MQSPLSAVSRWVLLASIVVFVGVPLLSLLYGATHHLGGPKPGWTFEYIREVFTARTYLVPFVNTIWLAAIVSLIGGTIGLMLAFIMARIKVYGGSLWETIIVAPLFVSPFIGVIGWITLAQPRAGLLNSILSYLGLPQVNVFGFKGAVLTMGLFFAPYSYLLVRDALERLNPEMEEAAEITGASYIERLRHVTIPTLLPGIFSGAIFIFILAAEMFSIPGLLLAREKYFVLSYVIFSRTTQYPLNYSEAAASGLLLLLITLIGVFIYQRLTRVQERFVSIGPRSSREKPKASNTFVRILGTTLCFLFGMTAFAMPLLAIVVRAILPYFSGDLAIASFTTANISAILRDTSVQHALLNSLKISVIGGSGLVLVSFLVAVTKVRFRDKLSAMTSFLVTVPIAIPGSLFGIGLLWAYIRTPVYATIWIIVLVMMARFLPIITRMFETALMQLGKELEEVAAVCGATERVITVRIRFPLLLGTLRSVMSLAWIQVLHEVTASVLLFTSTSSVLPVVVFNYMFDGDYGRASVLALIQVLVQVGVIGILNGLFKGASQRKKVTHAKDAIESQKLYKLPVG